MTNSILDELSPTRAAILRLLKTEGSATIPRVALALGVTHEAARKQVADLQRSGWVASDCGGGETGVSVPAAGRPPARYCLTPSGERLFPRQYPELTVGLLDTIAREGGRKALIAVLARITDDRVARLQPRAPLSLKRTMERLRAIYSPGDPYVDVQRRGGDYVLTERNCPYLDVALQRPELCSTTVSVLRRLTGREVVRERRFQDGDGRCEFHIRAAPVAAARAAVRFEVEPPKTPA